MAIENFKNHFILALSIFNTAFWLYIYSHQIEGLPGNKHAAELADLLGGQVQGDPRAATDTKSPRIFLQQSEVQKFFTSDMICEIFKY